MPNRKILALALAALVGFYILPQVRAGMEARLAPIQPSPEPRPDPVPVSDFDRRTAVTLLDGDRLVTLSLRDYLCGVLCAELPADFPEECWKAQAVAARSYTLYKMERTPAANHLGAQMCTDYTCCTAYRSPEEALAVWSGADKLVALAESAVTATDGLVSVYEGEVIGAVWHSASAPYTAAAAQVWGGEVPYLQEAESPGGADSSSYRTETRFPLEQLRADLLAAVPGAQLGADPARWLSDPVRSKGGYIVTVQVGGIPVRGSTLRSILALPSAALTWQVEDTGLTVTSLGTGHGVGMSQYGAARMAREGAAFDEILAHYYIGTKLLRKS